MADTTQTIYIDESAGHVFDHLRDVSRMPHYLGFVEEAEPAEGDRVHIRARIPAEQSEDEQPGDEASVEGEGWFRANEDTHRIEWGFDGPHHYTGSLHITGDDTGSELEVRISTDRADDETVRDEMGDVLTRLKARAESGLEDAAPGPRHQADETTAADAGLVG